MQGSAFSISAEDFLVADAKAAAECLRCVRTADAAAVTVFDRRGRKWLRDAAAELEFRRARPVVGEGERTVTQDFDICDDVPEDGAFGACAGLMADLVNAGLDRMDAPPCPRVTFNDLVVQHYQPVASGISPHRDHVRYVNLVGILVIDGAGDFYVCDDRQGHGARRVAAPEGSLLLMRAPGFDDSRHRPFHMLGEVTRERLILGLRQDSRSGEPRI